MMRHLLPTWLALAAVAAVTFCSAADKAPQRLSKADKELLQRLIGNPLTDPTGKQYCTVTVVARSCWGSAEEVEVAAWYQPAVGKTPARVYFTDGDWIAASEDLKERDFLAESKALLTPREPGRKEESFRRMRMVAAGSAAGVPSLARAAWLAKLGHEELAAKIVAKLKGDDTRWGNEPKNERPHERLVRRLTTDLAWRAYADTVHAYMQRADLEALRHAKRLNKKYPDFATEFGDGKALLAELERRQRAETLGKAAAEKRDEFDSWEKERQVRWLIGQLDEVDARQWSQPGGVHLAGDWRVEALIAIGDPAVERLIETIEQDRRLTRSVHFWRDFARRRTVLSVREAALSAVMSILKVRVFEPASTGDNFTSRGEEAATDTAERLRRYWNKHGQMPFEDRMMAVLIDKTSNQEAMREAAVNLARISDQRTLGTTVFSDVETVGPDEAPPNPAIKKFKNPTAAEAMLAAMDRDLAQHDKTEKGGGSWDYRRRRIERTYFHAVMQLGDERIAPELRRRCDAADTLRMRRQYAFATHVLGDAEPLNAFANEFKAGRIAFPANDRDHTSWDEQPGTVELAGIVGALGSAKTPAADAALAALTDPKHPGYAIAAQAIRDLKPGWSDDEAWFAHRYCIKLLGRELDNTTLTGTVVSVNDEGHYVERHQGGSSSGSIPDVIADPASRRQRAELRRCDVAASKLHELVIGLPGFHPLMKDADQRLDKLRKTLEQSMGSLRSATSEEREKHDRRWGPVYVIE